MFAALCVSSCQAWAPSNRSSAFCPACETSEWVQGTLLGLASAIQLEPLHRLEETKSHV